MKHVYLFDLLILLPSHTAFEYILLPKDFLSLQEESSSTKLQSCKVAKVQSSKVQRCKGAKVQRFKGAKVQSARVQRCKVDS